MTDPSPVPVAAAKRRTKKMKVFKDDVDESECDESGSEALAVFSDDGGQGNINIRHPNRVSNVHEEKTTQSDDGDNDSVVVAEWFESQILLVAKLGRTIYYNKKWIGGSESESGFGKIQQIDSQNNKTIYTIDTLDGSEVEIPSGAIVSVKNCTLCNKVPPDRKSHRCYSCPRHICIDCLELEKEAESDGFVFFESSDWKTHLCDKCKRHFASVPRGFEEISFDKWKDISTYSDDGDHDDTEDEENAGDNDESTYSAEDEGNAGGKDEESTEDEGACAGASKDEDEVLMNNIALCFVGRGVTSMLDGFDHNKKRNFARELLKSATDDLCPEPYVRDEFSREWDTLMRLFHQSSDDTRSFKGPLKDQSWPLLLMKLCRIIHTEHCSKESCKMCHPKLDGGASNVKIN